MPCRFYRSASTALLAVLAFAVPGAAQLYDSNNMVLLAHRDDFSGSYSDLWGFVGTNGREYIIQHCDTGSLWWDVNDPTNPVLVKNIPGPFSSWRDAFVIGTHAYLGTEGGGGIQIVDISDPADPTLVGVYNATVDNSHTIFGDVARKLIFVMGGAASAANGGLQILDATDPVNLVEIGRWTNQYVHDGSFEGNVFHACLINQGRFRLIDITNPATPVSLGNFFQDPTGGVHTSWPLGDGVHVAVTEETNGGHLKIMDVSNVSAITVTTEANPAPSTSAHNCHVQGNRLYVAWYTRGTRVYDVSTPASISEIGYFDTYPATGGLFDGNWGVYPHLPSGLIAANDISNGLFLMAYDANAGKIEGVISSSGGGAIQGANVGYSTYQVDQTTGATGQYRFAVHPGSGQTVRASAYGHAPDSATVSVAPHGTTTANIVLQKYPSGALAGRVTDFVSGVPIELVELSLTGTPLTATTNSNGDYSFPSVPTLPSANYQLRVLRYGYVVPAPFPVTVIASSVVTKDIRLKPAAQHENFATHAGWSVTNDPATTSGLWTFGEPTGTFFGPGVPCQTDFDHTLNPENQCAVTGNGGGGIGDDDVDGGATRLFSPVYNLSALAQPHAFFYRWYAQATAALDPWQVHVTSNGGASWTLLDSTVFNEALWKPVDIDLTGIVGSATAVQFRFTCEDPPPGQIVEGALDDFTIYDAAGGATGIALPSPAAMPLQLAQSFPNPFRKDATIDFTVPSKRPVRLDVFDVRGARVATIVDKVLEAGRHRVIWDGRDYTGQRAAAGVYFYELRTGDEVRTRKMVRFD